MIHVPPRTRLAILPLAAAFALGACSAEPEQTVYETDTEDLSGGEMIVTEEDLAAVPVNTPDTPMSPVPVDQPTPEPGAE